MLLRFHDIDYYSHSGYCELNTFLEHSDHSLTLMNNVLIKNLENLIFLTKYFTSCNMSQHLRYHCKILSLLSFRNRLYNSP